MAETSRRLGGAAGIVLAMEGTFHDNPRDFWRLAGSVYQADPV
jgi:hypothetical protein